MPFNPADRMPAKANSMLSLPLLCAINFRAVGVLSLERRLPARPRRMLPACLGNDQDFLSETACTECETTGTGCAAGSNPANGSGVGCPMNWKMAAATLKTHVA